MKMIVLANIVISGVAVAILGLTDPAQAAATPDTRSALHSVPESKMGVDHLNWLDEIQQKVNVPKVDPSVRQSR